MCSADRPMPSRSTDMIHITWLIPSAPPKQQPSPPFRASPSRQNRGRVPCRPIARPSHRQRRNCGAGQIVTAVRPIGVSCGKGGDGQPRAEGKGHDRAKAEQRPQAQAHAAPPRSSAITPPDQRQPCPGSAPASACGPPAAPQARCRRPAGWTRSPPPSRRRRGPGPGSGTRRPGRSGCQLPMPFSQLVRAGRGPMPFDREPVKRAPPAAASPMRSAFSCSAGQERNQVIGGGQADGPDQHGGHADQVGGQQAMGGGGRDGGGVVGGLYRRSWPQPGTQWARVRVCSAQGRQAIRWQAVRLRGPRRWGRKSAAFRLAPPTKAPSTSGRAKDLGGIGRA
jgi:hypothetical protein